MPNKYGRITAADWEWDAEDLPPATESERLAGAGIMMSLGMAGLAIWLVCANMSNRAWRPEYPLLQIHSATVSGLSQHITWWNITLLTTNPNRNLGLEYVSIEPSVYYGDKADWLKTPWWFEHTHVVATKKLSARFGRFGFFLNKGGNQTSLINVNPVAVMSEDVSYDLATQISEELALRGSVKFGLMIKLKFNLKADEKRFDGPWTKTFFCNQVEFLFAPNDNDTGIFTGHSCECPVNVPRF